MAQCGSVLAVHRATLPVLVWIIQILAIGRGGSRPRAGPSEPTSESEHGCLPPRDQSDRVAVA
jgi:hypothetical protein